ncbi:MAG: CBS domain-containing protein [Sphingomonadales bacterium]
MRVEDILKEKGRRVITVTEDVILLDALKEMKSHRIGAVLVTNSDGTVCGVLSERDVARGLPEHGASILKKPVGFLMTKKVISCTADDTIAKIMKLMTDNRIRHLPVISKGKLGGLISIGDVVKFRIEEAENEADALRSYIATA